MQQFWYRSLFLFVLMGVAHPLTAAEPYWEFLEALRSHGYLDYTITYIDLLEKKPGVPTAIRDILDFERATTLIQQSSGASTVESKNALLDKAQVFLEKFEKAHPNHDLAGRANTQRGRILINRARIAIYELNSPANEKDKAAQNKYRAQARTLIAKAKAIFEKARDLYQVEWKKYPVYIPPAERERLAARESANNSYMRAQVDVALCMYEEARTSPEKSPGFNKQMLSASKEFENVHTKYRTFGGGLYARMWQGKCFEELDEKQDIRRALGIYNELLGHPGKSATLKKLQDQVRQFRLICLNHESKKDYLLVIDESAQWLARNRAPSRLALGIRWEKTRAEAELAKQRELSEKDRERYLRSALADAMQINRFSGQYKDVSTYMIQNLKVALGRDDKDPEDFDTAYGMGENMIREIAKMEDDVNAEKDPTKKLVLIDNMNNRLRENARIFQLALTLVNNRTSAKQLNQTRYYLGYLYYMLEENYEASVFAGFAADHGKQHDQEMALQAASLDQAIWVQAYYAVPTGSSKDFERSMIQKACERIIAGWPQSEQAGNALINLGTIYKNMNKPALAAEQFNRIPATQKLYARAQVEAGQSYWVAYQNAARLSEAERPNEQTIAKWQAAAEMHLRKGIQAMAAKVAKNQPAPEKLITGKISLSQILMNGGKYDDAIKLLAIDPYSVIKAIAVKDEKTRPKKGIKGQGLARLTLQILLRCYVSTQQIDKASAVLKQLESLGGSADSSMYVSLGKQLSDEIGRLKKLNQTARLEEVRNSFDKFLDVLYQKNSGQTYGSLIWIAETYFGLGNGMQDDPVTAAEYFKKASASYQKIINRGEAEGATFLGKASLLPVQLRLVNSLRQEGAYQKAYDLTDELLKEMPKDISAQMAVAQLLQSWGESDPEQSGDKLLLAITGNTKSKQPGLIWGWGNIANRLQSALMMQPRGSSRIQGYEERQFTARYNSLICRIEYGKAQPGTPKRNKHLEMAKAELVGFVSIAGEINEENWNKLDTLYQDLQRDLSEQEIVALERPQAVKSGPTPLPPVKRTPDEIANANSDKKPAPAPLPEPPNMLLVILGFSGALAVAAALVFMMMKSSKKPSVRVSYADEAPDLSQISIGKKKSSSRSRAKQKQMKLATATQSKRKSASQEGTRERSSKQAGAKKQAPRKEGEGASATTRKKRPPTSS